VISSYPFLATRTARHNIPSMTRLPPCRLPHQIQNRFHISISLKLPFRPAIPSAASHNHKPARTCCFLALRCHLQPPALIARERAIRRVDDELVLCRWLSKAVIVSNLKHAIGISIGRNSIPGMPVRIGTLVGRYQLIPNGLWITV
jgi:hypothetical protein